MKLERIKIGDIVPAKYNPRKISDVEYENLNSSINEFGFVDPIIINLKNNHIIGGHQRYKVLIDKFDIDDELICVPLGDIGWVFPDSELVIKDESHEKALNIALNKISGSWDNEKLQDLIVNLEVDDVDLDLTGFEEYEIDKLKYDCDVEFDENNLNNNTNEVNEELDTKDNNDNLIKCPFCEQHFKEEDVI